MWKNEKINKINNLEKGPPIVRKGTPPEIWAAVTKSLPKCGADMPMGWQQILGTI